LRTHACNQIFAHLGKEGYRNIGTIIGGALGGLVAISLIIIAVFCCCCIVKKISMFVSYTSVAIAV